MKKIDLQMEILDRYHSLPLELQRDILKKIIGLKCIRWEEHFEIHLPEEIPFGLINYDLPTDYRLNLAIDLTTAMDWNTTISNAMKRVDLAEAEGLIRRVHTELTFEAVEMLSLFPYQLYKAIRVIRFLVMAGLIQVLTIQTWTRWSSCLIGFYQSMPTELYEAITEYCFAHHPHEVLLVANYIKRPRTPLQRRRVIGWPKRQRRIHQRLLYHIKYPSFFEDRDPVLDLDENDDPWMFWSRCFGPTF